MRITVQEVTLLDDKCSVRFSGPHGSASGRWQGEQPKLGHSYDVELDIPPINSSDVKARPAQRAGDQVALREEGGSVVLVGWYAAGEGGTPGALRIGNDVVLLDAELPDFENNTPVELLVPYIKLYPYEL